MYHPFIVGKKLYLRGIEREDLSGNMSQWVNDSEVTKYMVMGLFPNSGVIYCSTRTLEEEYDDNRASLPLHSHHQTIQRLKACYSPLCLI